MGQTDGTQNTVFLFSGHLIREGRVNQVDNAKEELNGSSCLWKPSVDFGMPGELVHFVEQFYKNGYEELLIASVSEKPTPHNIWMLHRCYNDIDNPQHEKFAEVIKKLKNEESISTEIQSAIDEFDWE